MIFRMILRHMFQCYIILLLSQDRISETRSLDVQKTEVEDMCTPPSNRPNSQINLTQEFLPIGTIVNYTCDPGYYLFGNDVRTCQRYNTWSGDSPLCMKKVSLGTSVNCTGELTCRHSEEESLQLLVDNNDDTCYQLPEPSDHEETFQWTIDLQEDYKQIGAFRFVFKGISGEIPIVRISLESFHKKPIALLPTECSIEQKPLFPDLSEIIIRPNGLQWARFVHIFIKTRQSNQKTRFCAAQVFAEDAPAVHQCFDTDSIDGTVESRTSLSNTITYGTSCYTFDSSVSNVWVTANQRCITTNDGKLAHGVTPEVKSVLTNFVKAKNMVSHYWIGGRTQKKTVPGLKGYKVIWQWNNGEEIDRALWDPDKEPIENQCLGINAPSGILLAYPCSSYTGYLCQTAIKRCSRPEINEGVTLNGAHNTKVGAIITYTCPEGYTMEGDHTRACMPNGKWSGNAARCSHKETQKENYEMSNGSLIGVIVAGILVGLLIILIVITVVIVKRRGSFKKTLHFKKSENGESVETLDSNEKLKHKQSLTECPKENYQSVNGEQQHHELHEHHEQEPQYQQEQEK